MSTARRRSARESSSSSAGPGTGAGGGSHRRRSARRRARGGLPGIAALVAATLAAGVAAGAEPEPLAAAERELARTQGLYLVVTAEPPAVEVKARGLTLDRLPLAGVAVLLRREARGDGTTPAALPGVWRVSEEGAVDAPRRLIAPEELVRLPADGAEGPAAAAEQEPLPEPPSEYCVGLDGGWELWIGAELPATGPLARFGAAVAGGWRALWRSGPEPPSGALALAADPVTARRLHHLFRAGLPILVAGPEAAVGPGVALAERRP